MLPTPYESVKSCEINGNGYDWSTKLRKVGA